MIFFPDKYQAKLAAIAQQHNSHVEATRVEIAANMNALTDVAKRSEKHKCTRSEITELLADADLAIRAIHQRISSCEMVRVSNFVSRLHFQDRDAPI